MCAGWEEKNQCGRGILQKIKWKGGREGGVAALLFLGGTRYPKEGSIYGEGEGRREVFSCLAPINPSCSVGLLSSMSALGRMIHVDGSETYSRFHELETSAEHLCFFPSGQ